MFEYLNLNRHVAVEMDKCYKELLEKDLKTANDVMLAVFEVIRKYVHCKGHRISLYFAICSAKNIDDTELKFGGK